MDKRKIEENIFVFAMRTATFLVIAVLFLILATVVVKGLPALNMDMITKIPEGGFYLGKAGGVLNAILGSLYISVGAILLSLMVALPVVLYVNVYAKKGSKRAYFARFSFDVLWGIPSIVYGAFGFSLMLFLGLRASLLGGIITVAFLVLPIMCRAMDEVMRMVPSELLESAYSLGATKLETAVHVVIRQTIPGILTAVMISMGRGIGDAASVIFTAGFTDHIPTSLFDPAATLPLAIFFQLGTPFPEVQDRAYASALILTVMILLISIAVRFFGRRLSKNVTK
ncbi:MAG: phosphate ABC transporter permease PstA [Candidatus Omnitrophota bacterium]